MEVRVRWYSLGDMRPRIIVSMRIFNPRIIVPEVFEDWLSKIYYMQLCRAGHLRHCLRQGVISEQQNRQSIHVDETIRQKMSLTPGLGVDGLISAL